MKEPEKFDSVFSKCFIIIIGLVTGFAGICYYGYGYSI